MSDNHYDVEEGKEVVGRTIVGGRPLTHRKRRLRIPIGIEKLLCRAAADPTLRAALRDDRAAAIAELAPELDEGERQILAAIPQTSLDAMLKSIDLKRHPKRRFMKGVVAASLAAMTAAAGGMLVTGCDDTGSDTGEVETAMRDTVGIDTNISTDIIEVKQVTPDAGVVPAFDTLEDTPQDLSVDADILDHDNLPAPGGILPDTD